jgi:uncharacterized protein (DUF2147 family)
MRRFRRLTCALRLGATALSALLASPAEATGTNPDGIWLRGDGNAKVDIGPCEIDGRTKLCATNLWIGDTTKGEEVGDRLIMTMHPTATGGFAGDAYDPKRGRSYSIVMTVSPDKMTTRGCVFLGLLCKTVSWRRLPQ